MNTISFGLMTDGVTKAIKEWVSLDVPLEAETEGGIAVGAVTTAGANARTAVIREIAAYTFYRVAGEAEKYTRSQQHKKRPEPDGPGLGSPTWRS